MNSLSHHSLVTRKWKKGNINLQIGWRAKLENVAAFFGAAWYRRNINIIIIILPGILCYINIIPVVQPQATYPRSKLLSK